MNRWDPNAYGSACAALLKHEEPTALGPGTPDESMRRTLEKLDPRSLTGDLPLVDREMAACCISGLWLRHGFLAESHTVSQSIPTQSGSYWHGIMHRREPDYENAKYWFRRVGSHSVFPQLHEFAHQTAVSTARDSSGWPSCVPRTHGVPMHSLMRAEPWPTDLAPTKQPAG